MTSIETYKKVAKRYHKKSIELGDGRVNGFFRDFSSNLLTTLLGYPQIMDKENISSEDRKGFVKSLRDLKKYLRLVEKFPEFRDGEINNSRGAFPDLYDLAEKDWEENGGGLFMGYVNRAEQRLLGGAL